MTRIVNARAPYQSELRAEQAEETRVRILEATLRVMARGIASVSIPDVAREAGVSVPTVYRHFGTKRDLLGAVYGYLVQRSGMEELVPPRSLAELRDGVRALFDRLETAGDLARAAMVSPAGEEARRSAMPTRLSVYRQLADSLGSDLAKRDRDRMARLLTVLISGSSLRIWRDYLGSSVAQAADDIDWVIRAALAAARKE